MSNILMHYISYAQTIQVINKFPASCSALKSVHLIETSITMQRLQQEKLLPASKEGSWDLLWHDSLNDVPQETEDYTMLVAHEFFDALPIHMLEVSVTVNVYPMHLFTIIIYEF